VIPNGEHALTEPVPLQGQLVSTPLTNPVTLNGVMNPAEWSDASPINVNLGFGIPPKAPYISAEIWSKYDSNWIYFLYRITWPSNDISKMDAGFVEYFWGQSTGGLTTQYSNYGQVNYGNQVWEGYGYNGKMFQAEPQSDIQNNLQGAASYDGTHYWFEFRKALNSGDGLDWALTPGHTYGWENGTSVYDGFFSLGLYRGLTGDIYIAYITVDLSTTPIPEFGSVSIVAFFGLAVCVYVLRRSSRAMSRRR